MNLNFSIDARVNSIPSAIGSSIKKICSALPITKVIAITVSGYAARAVSSQMIKQQIIAVSNVYENAKCFNLYRGTMGFYANIKFSNPNKKNLKKYIRYKKLLIKTAGKV